MKRLPDWPEDAFAVRKPPESVGPGNIVMIEPADEHVTEISSGFGKLGASSESIAKDAARRLAGFMATDAFAEPYLADQLLLPFALAGGGQFTTVKPSQHSRTAADIIALFTGRTTRFEEESGKPWLVRIG